MRSLPHTLVCFFLLIAATSHGQINLAANTIQVENFNSLGSSATTTLPANWRLSPSGNAVGAWSAGVTTTTQAANSGLPTTGGRYNWGTTAGTDRSIGFLTSASYNSANAVMAYYRNGTGAGVSTITVAYNVERYLVNTGSFSLALQYSTDGVTWTAAPGGDIPASIFAPGANAGTFSTPLTISRTVAVNVSLPNNGDIYFRWTFTTTNTASQGLGLDDVAVFAGPPTPVMVATLRDILQVDNGTPNQFNGGDVIRYQTVVKNTGTDNANGVQITLPTPPANTTMVAGSIKTSALAVDDNYTASFNTVLNGTTVLPNDVGIPTPTAVLTYGPSNNVTIPPGVATTTDAGGAITLQANGTFTYTPPTGFSGADKFKYITGNGNLPNNDAVVTITVAPDISFTTTNVDPSCSGGANGSITFNTSGGNGSLQYSITGAGGTYQATNVFTGLAAGTYNLAVKDAGGYIKTSTTTLNNPAPLVVSGTIPGLTYQTAMSPITFTKTGGTGAVTWSATGLPNGVVIIASTGQVSGTPTVTGSFSIVVTATDAYGCTGTKSQTVTVAPNLSNDAYTQVVGNTQLVADAHSTPTTPFTSSATNILTNDASNAVLTVTAGTFATTGGGSITIATDGKFTYTPPVGSTAADNYTYTATSNGVSATATINFTLTNMVWYVKAGGAAGDGRSNTPLNTLPNGTIGSIGHYIYVQKEVSGTTPGAITLQASQQLIGAGANLSVGVLSLTGAAGNTPTLTGTVTLANSINATGFSMNNGAATAFTNAGTTVTGATVNVGAVTTTTGSGISLTGTGNSVTMTLSSLTTNGAVNVVNLTNTAGSVTINGGSLIGGAGAVVNISGGTVGFTYSGSASQTTAAQPLVNIAGGHASGTVLFQTGTLTATNGTGLQFDNADGTYNFNGTTTLNGGDAGIDILSGSAGTFSFAPAMTITNPSGVALNIQNSGATVNFGAGLTVNKGTTAGNGVVINANSGVVTFNSLAITTSNGVGLQGTNNSGAITVTNGTGSISATGGAVIDITNASSNPATDLKFTTVTSINSTGYGINLTRIGGPGVSIPGAVTLSFAAGSTTGININNSTATSINIGTNGTTHNAVGVNSRRATGVLLNAVSGTVQFGNVTVANPNNAGGYGLRIESSSANITINTANISDANIVTMQTDPGADFVPDNDGDGDGIFLKSNTGNFTLNGGTVSNSGNDGIDVRDCNNITLNNVTVNTAGVDVDGATNGGTGGHCIQAINLKGTNQMTGGTITGFTKDGRDGIRYLNHVSTASTFTIQGVSFTNPTNATTGSNGIFVSGRDNANMHLIVGGPTNSASTNCTFLNLPGQAILHNAGDNLGSTATVNLTVKYNTFSGTPGGGPGNNCMSARNLAGGKATVIVENNTFNNVGKTTANTAGVIDIGADATDAGNSISFSIKNNTISNIGNGAANSCGSLPCHGMRGIDIFIDDNSNISGPILIEGNQLTNIQRNGIIFDVGSVFNGSNFTAKVINNTVGTDAAPVGLGTALSAGGESGIRIENRSTNGKQINILVSGNSVRNGNGGTGSSLNTSGIFIRSQNTANLQATITSNNVSTLSSVAQELRADVGGPAGSTSTSCIDASGNTLAGGAGLIAVNQNLGTMNVKQTSAANFASVNGIPAGNLTTSGTINFGISCAAPPARVAQAVSISSTIKK